MLIASRMLKLRKGRDEIPIEICIFAPRKAESGSWFCRYEIDWPDENHQMDVGGADSVQALVLALQTIGAEIYTSNYHKAGALFVEHDRKGYGFPVMSNLRDLLVGDDAKYL
jgi:hypothetical protein